MLIQKLNYIKPAIEFRQFQPKVQHMDVLKMNYNGTNYTTRQLTMWKNKCTFS